MNRTTIIVIAAAALVVAFIAGNFIEFDQDGPVEETGEAIDDAVDKADQ